MFSAGFFIIVFSESSPTKRVIAYTTMCFAYGLLVGDLMNFVNGLLMLVGLMCIMVSFVAFSVCVLNIEEYYRMYHVAILLSSSGALAVFWWFNTFNLILTNVVLVFILYMAFGTSVIFEKYHHGDYDYVSHAIEFYVDFIPHLIGLFYKRHEQHDEDEETKTETKDTV